MLMVIFYILKRDVVRWRRLNFLTDLCKEKKCPIPIPEFVQSILLPWAENADEKQWEAMRAFIAVKKKYPCMDYIAEPLLFVVKGAPDLMDIVQNARCQGSDYSFGKQMCDEIKARYEDNQMSMKGPVDQ